MSDELPPKEEFSEWYNELLFQAEIMDVRYPAKGVYVWFPFGQQLRNHVYDELTGRLDDTGHDEVDFPVLIPEAILAQEGEHIAGFEDEVFWVTHAGRRELDERLALRPTSETPMYTMFDLWIRSHTDLPLSVYQVVDIWRAETEHTRPLIRLREITGFKEAHTVHASYDAAERQVAQALDLYGDFYDWLGVPHLAVRRPEWDKFPGADDTYAVDTLMPDGKALQVGTAHNLGQNFSEAFDVAFENEDGEQEYAYQTSYGVSERCIAAVMSVHGDDNGLVLPHETAPTQVVIVPVLFGDDDENAEIMEVCEQIEADLDDAGYRVELDDSDQSPGAKYYEWELQGTPLRVEVGPRDLESGTAVLNDRLGNESEAPFEAIEDGVAEALEDCTATIREEAQAGFEDRVRRCDDYGDAEDWVGEGFVAAGWCGEEECGLAMEDALGVDLLGEPVEVDTGAEAVEDAIQVGSDDSAPCLECGSDGDVVYLAKTY